MLFIRYDLCWNISISLFYYFIYLKKLKVSTKEHVLFFPFNCCYLVFYTLKEASKVPEILMVFSLQFANGCSWELFFSFWGIFQERELLEAHSHFAFFSDCDCDSPYRNKWGVQDHATVTTSPTPMLPIINEKKSHSQSEENRTEWMSL